MPQGDPSVGRRLRGCTDLPVIPYTGCQEGQLKQYAGAAEQGDPAANQGGRHLPQPGVLSAVGNDVSDGVLGRLVSDQVVPER